MNFAGLLTVDPKQRLQMKDLLTNEWLQGSNISVYPMTPLMTPDVLTTGSSARSAEMGVKKTFKAFHQAHKEGFRLQDVVNAKLAQRRRMKKSTDLRSCSSSSSFSTSSSSGTSSIKMPMKVSQSGSVCSVASSSRAHSNNNNTNVFNFNAKRVEEYLSSLSSSGEDSASPSPAFALDSAFGGKQPSIGTNVDGEPSFRLTLPRKRQIDSSEDSASCFVIEQPPVLSPVPHKPKRGKKTKDDCENCETKESNHCDQRKEDELSAVMSVKCCDMTKEESVPSMGPLTRSKKRKLESDSSPSDKSDEEHHSKRKRCGKERNRRKARKRCLTVVLE